MKYSRFLRFTRFMPRHRCQSERKNHKTVVPRFRKRTDLSGCIGDPMASRSFRLFLFSMSRFRFFLVAAILLITIAHAQVVEIPDPNLEKAIRDQLNLEFLAVLPNEPITQFDMLRLGWLDGRGKNITDLTGLEYATNATHLYLSDNAIENLEPLAGLTNNLWFLDLYLNRIQDITPLANLINITHLFIDGNAAITDITPLSGLMRLQILNFSNNQIVDITPLANLTNLTELRASNNQVRDLTPLVNLTALEILWLNNNAIVDITPMSGLKNLKELRLADNPIGDVSPLTELEGLELELDIDLSRYVVVNIPDPNLEQAIRDQLNRERPTLPLDAPITQQDMLRLTWLDGRGKNITDLTGLEYATNLDYLYLGGNAIQNLESLAGLTKLVHLDLYENRIQDITPLANLINLEVLFIHGNLVTDITPLQGLNISEFVYAEVCDIPPTLPPVRERIESRTFPSIFAWRGRIEVLGFDHLTNDQRAALHDLNFSGGYAGWYETPAEPYRGIATSMGGNLPPGRASHQRQLDLNPNIISLIEIRLHAHFIDESYPPGSDFWLRDENGEIIRRRHGLPLINFLKPEVQDLIVKRIVAVARCGLYDGIMIDGFRYNGTGFSGRSNFPATHEEIIQAYLNIFRAARSQVRDDFLIIANTNRDRPTFFKEYFNGSFMETGVDYAGGYHHEGLKELERTLTWLEQNLREPQINCLEGWGIGTEPPDSPENQRNMRVITTLSLTHSDGYVMYNIGETEQHEHIWYDFWDADLGQPVGPKARNYQNIEGLFIREFTNGWAVYNRSGQAQTITFPQFVDPVGNADLHSSSTHLLPDLDGEIYLKAKNPADVNGDGRINILDLVQVANGFGKSSPDLNGDGTVNILDLTLVAQQFSQ